MAMDNFAIPYGAKRTISLCPVCNKNVDAWLYKKSADIYMHSFCNEHGGFDAKYFKDADLFYQATRLADNSVVCRDLKCTRGESCRDHLKNTYNIMVNITQRCNMNCPVCFADAQDHLQKPEPSLEEIITRLPRVRGVNKPNVVFIGGEPTLRKDLPELIIRAKEKGFIPRVSTNGIKLLDLEYARTLARAGLCWVVLQFDGVTEEVYEKMRGRPLLEEKKKIIVNCEKAGIAVQLAVMVEAGTNDDQLGKIIEFAFQTPAIKWVNFYPRTDVNRDRFETKAELYIADMFSLFESQTKGQLKKWDFVSMMKVLSSFHKITKVETLRQKISTWPMVLIKTDKGIVPLSRLISPRGISRHLGTVSVVLKNLPKILNFQKMKMPPDILFITIEKFHNRFAVDLCEASCCHMSFMTKEGFVPFDIYNTLYRDKSSW